MNVESIIAGAEEYKKKKRLKVEDIIAGAERYKEQQAIKQQKQEYNNQLKQNLQDEAKSIVFNKKQNTDISNLSQLLPTRENLQQSSDKKVILPPANYNNNINSSILGIAPKVEQQINLNEIFEKNLRESKQNVSKEILLPTRDSISKPNNSEKIDTDKTIIDMKSYNQTNLSKMENSKRIKDMTPKEAINTVGGILGNVALGIEQNSPNAMNWLASAEQQILKEKLQNNISAESINTRAKIDGKYITLFSLLNDNVVNTEAQKKWRTETIQKNIDKSYGAIGKYFSEQAVSIGSNIGNMGLSAINPALGTLSFMLSAAGNYLYEAKERGMDDKSAIGYSGLMGMIEGGTEAIISGDMLKKGTKLFGVKGVAKEKLEKVINSFGFNILENTVQEGLTEPINELTAGLVAGEKYSNFDNIVQRSFKSAFDGAISAIILGGVSIGINGCINIYEKSKNKEKVSIPEIKNAIEEARKKGIDVDSVLVQNVQNIVNEVKAEIQYTENNQNVENQLENLKEEIIKKQEELKNTQDIREKQIIQEQINLLNSEINKASESKINDLNNSSQQITQKENKTNYQYKTSENLKIDNIRKDASKYWHNSEKTKSLVNTIEKVITDKNYNVRLDETITNPKGEKVNAQITTLKDGEVEIKINPNSNNIGEFLIMHEVTHAIETEEIKNLIIDHAQKNTEFNKSLEALKTTYGVEDVTSEVVADISGQLLGNQEYINNLSIKKPNIFKRIYNKIIEIANKITGNSKESLFIKDLKNKWENAYRTQNNNLNENTYFSTIYNKDGSFNRVKIEENIFEKNNSKSITKTIKDYLTEHIGEYATIIESGQKVYLGEDLPSEYAYSKSSQNLPISSKLAKGRASTNLKEIIENSTNRRYEKNKKEKHNQDGKYGFYKYDTKFSFNYKGKEQIYEGTVLIRNDIDGKKYLYDILGIKKIGSDLLPVASNSSKSSAIVGSSNNLPTLSIPQNKNNSNTNIKYSMQKNKNNTWQEFLNKNYKPTGTRTNLEEIRLPVIENKKQGVDEKNKYRYVGKTNKLIKEKNNKISILENDLEQAISEEAKQLLKNQINIIENDYNNKIQELYDNVNGNIKITNENNIEELEKFSSFNLQFKDKKIIAPLPKKLSDNFNDWKSPTLDYISEKRRKSNTSIKNIKDTLSQKFVNKGHYIDKLANETGNKELTYLYDRILSVYNEAQVSLGVHQVNSKGEVTGESLLDIFEGARKEKISKEFDDYLLNKHNVSRYAYEKGLYGKKISAIDSQKIVDIYEKKYPQFKEWSKKVRKYNDNNLSDLVDNGLVSESTYKKLKTMYGDYVPTFRDITNNIQDFIPDDSVGNNPLGKATQSNKKILSISESMAEQTLAIKKAIRVNNLGLELYKTIGKDKEFLNGIEYDALAIQTIGGDVIEKARDGQAIFTIWNNGELKQFKISNELYTAFEKDTLQNKINNSKVAKILLTPLEKISNVRRNLLTTYNPVFGIVNCIKDFQEAQFNTKFNVLQYNKNYIKAVYEIATKGSWYQQYINSGGASNSYFDYDKGLLPSADNLIGKFKDKLPGINEAIEQVPRLAEFICTIENGSNINEAMYNAAEITTNFKRGGDITKVANKYGANFLNASVQGLDKLIRNITGQHGFKGYANLLVKATLWAVAPAIVNGILLGDDDDYQKLQDYIKDNYFLIPKGKGIFFRVPKGRISAVLGGITRRILETAQGKDVDWESLTETALTNIAPNNPLEDNIIAPIKQTSENKTWYGTNLIPSRLADLPVREQYDESTSSIAIWLGNKLGLSPYKINYLIDQYSGGIGDVVLPMTTQKAENGSDSIVGKLLAPFNDKFTVDSVFKNKNVSEFYDLLEESKIMSNSSNATDEDILQYKILKNINSEMSDLYKQKREIQTSDLKDSEKYSKVREIQQQINNLAESGLENYKNFKITENYADVNGTEYYKEDDSWKKVEDKNSTKLDEMDLSNKEKNKYLKFESTLNGISKKYDKQSKALNKNSDSYEEDLKEISKEKKTNIINKIIDSKLSDDEKINLYKKYYNTETIDTIHTAGIDIDSYLEYTTKEFEADKNEKGKAIAGSRKEKVLEYVNSLDNLTAIQKAILIKSTNSFKFNDYNDEIIEYVSNLDLSYKEKKKLLESLNMEVDENGNVSWE